MLHLCWQLRAMLKSKHRGILCRSSKADHPICYRWDKVLPNSSPYSPRSVIAARCTQARFNDHRSYALQFPTLERWFPPLRTLAEVSVTDLSDGTIFKRSIPAVYLFHLHWIIEEAFPKEPVDKRRSGRCYWLRSILDAFAREIRDEEDTSDWRSKVLNPILVRAFYKADDFNKADINRQMKANCQLTAKVTDKHWEGFYHNQDVIAPVHRNKWLALKQVNPVQPSVMDTGKGGFPSNTTFEADTHELQQFQVMCLLRCRNRRTMELSQSSRRPLRHRAAEQRPHQYWRRTVGIFHL